MSISVERQVAKAKQAIKKGQIERAQKLYRDILEVFPNNVRIRDALDKLDTGSTGKVRPTGSNLQSSLGQLGQLFNHRRFGDVINLGQRLLQKYPRSGDLYNILGAANAQLDRLDDAVDCFSKALQIKPDSADVHNNLGNALRGLKRLEEAALYYNKALQLNPEHFDAHNNLGVVFKSMDEWQEAVRCFKRALRLNPKYAKAHFNLGNTYQDLGQPENAVGCYERAIELKPDYANAYKNMGAAYKSLRNLQAAQFYLTKALHFLPDDIALITSNLNISAQLCDWDAVYADPELISTSGVSDNLITPLIMLSLEDAPARHRARSQQFAKLFPQNELPSISPPANVPNRLRIGYFSAEFHNHPCMQLMAKMFEIHDRKQFSLYAFSYGADATDPMRDRLKSAFDEFHEVRSLGNRQVAELARSLGIDIAVHITGYTRNQRTGIFAHRAAPLQVSYLGYPGTLGVPFIDYMITDPVVVPAECRTHYTEKLICLPNTYMVTDNTREVSERPMCREEMGLPEQGFVYCCFNTHSKITPNEFDVWMRLLRNVENSVLWLREGSETSRKNLMKEAARRNVDPSRIILAERLPSLAEHLARHRLADLFLDTFNYNAHTTSCDALWAGLPVVTKIGQGFAARVAASLLTAIDLPELISHTVEEYEALALELATNPAKLKQVKSKLAQNRDTSPIFDTEKFTRHIESGFQQAYQRYFDGELPSDIIVEG